MTQLVHVLKNAQLQVLNRFKSRTGLLLSAAFVLTLISTYSFSKADIPGDSVAAIVILNVLAFPLGLVFDLLLVAMAKLPIFDSVQASNILLFSIFAIATVLQVAYVDSRAPFLNRTRRFFAWVGLILAIFVACLKIYSLFK